MSKSEFKDWTNEMLTSRWVAIGSERVKAGSHKGCVKIKSAKQGDRILVEAKARGLILPCE